MKKKNIEKGYVFGLFDMFNTAHLNTLKMAKKQCDYLVVGVASDILCRQETEKEPMIGESDRAEIVRSIKYVDEVFVQNSFVEITKFQELGINIYFLKDDYENSGVLSCLKDSLSSIGCSIVVLS